MDKDACLKEIEKFDHIVVYGAGKIGKKVLDILDEHGLSSKISCFTISKLDVDEMNFNGFQVKSVYDIESDYKQSLFLLAVSEKFMPEVEKIAQQLKIEHYVDGRALYLQSHVCISVKELFMQQNKHGGFNRYDIVVRYLAVENYYKKNECGFELYKKMQAKRVDDSYVPEAIEKFNKLIDSWENEGYKKESEIDCDKDLRLVDGSHRMALCLYFNVEKISCKVRSCVEDIDYGIDWFIENDFSVDEISIIQKKYNELMKKCFMPISCILWPPVYEYFDEITEKLKLMYEVKRISDYSFEKETFERAVKGIYHIDDIEDWKIDKKIQYMSQYKEKTIRILELMLPVPQFRLKEMNNKTLSAEGEIIKKIFRNCYKGKVEEYFHDIIMHTGDNYEQSEYITNLFQKVFSLRGYFEQLKQYKWVLIKSDVEYMPEDFPDSYPFSKDVDIVCLKEDYDSLVKDTIQYCQEVCPKRCKVNVIKEKGRTRVRIEQMGFLIFLFDVFKGNRELKDDFLKDTIGNRVENNGFYIPTMENELIFRALEYINYPNKVKHFEYIKQNRSKWNIEKAKTSIVGCEKQIEQLNVALY